MIHFLIKKKINQHFSQSTLFCNNLPSSSHILHFFLKTSIYPTFYSLPECNGNRKDIEEREGKTLPTAFVSTFNINIHSHSNNPFRTTSKFFLLSVVSFHSTYFYYSHSVATEDRVKKGREREVVCSFQNLTRFHVQSFRHISGCEMKNEFYWRNIFHLL